MSGGQRPSARGLSQAFWFREFRFLWAAEVVSVAGDQLARVALAVLVFGRTGSALWAATVYALTFLPALFGGVLFGGLADRFPRREVMAACDGVRALLVALMALPGMPIWALSALIVLVVLVAPVHTAAQGALLPTVLPGRAFEAGLAVRQITGQAAQVAGFALGGVLVALLSPPVALALNAASFAVSAVVLRVGLANRPAPAAQSCAARVTWSLTTVRRVVSIVMNDPRRRTFALLAWLVGCYVVPEALAAPYVTELEAGPAAVGMLMAADPAGSAVGVWVFTRYVPDRVRENVPGLLAVLAGLALALSGFAPGLWGSVLLWGVAGAAATSCLIQAQAAFVRATPDALRGRAIGFAAAGLIAVQGIAVLVSGFVAQLGDARSTVAGCGLLGMLGAGGLWVAHRRIASPASQQTPVADHDSGLPRARSVVTTRG